jgi:hypothetical protein
MKNPKVTHALALLFEAFNRQPTSLTFAAFDVALQGIDPDLIERACRLSLNRCRFMPAPAELREIALTDGTSYETVSQRAFVTLQRAAQRHGPDRSVCFHDGAINAAVRRLGGWPRVAGLDVAEFDKWFRRDFAETYARILRDGCDEDELRYHPGLTELKTAHLVGQELPGGGTFDRERHGGGPVAVISSGYRILLAAPEPTPQIAASERLQIGIKLKRIEAHHTTG